MPRHKRQRLVHDLPGYTRFSPEGEPFVENTAVVMTIEEYEAIRLMDHQGMTQEECAGYMEVGRTTVQQIYVDARRKLAEALVEGRPLLIQGGEYRLCDGTGPHCGQGGCHRYGRGCGHYENKHIP